MKSNEGIIGITPVIKKISFDHRGKIAIYLEDGRIIISPLKLFPSIARLTPTQRRYFTIADGNVIVFKDSDEIFHIEQFLGRPEDYRYHFSQKHA